VEWSERKQQEYFGTDYMKQFLQVCEDLDATAYVITNLPGHRTLSKRGRFIFDNHPNPSALKGVRYHLAFVPWFARVVPKIIRFRPDVLIVTDNASYWFLLLPLRWFAVPIIPSFHCVLWPQYAPRKLSSRILWQLNRFFILKHVRTIVLTSKAIKRQLRDLLGADFSRIDVKRHFPSYPQSQFTDITPPNLATRPPFRVFFIGRIETNKGVYDILEIAVRLNVERKGLFYFDICGEGSELGNLRKRVTDLNLQEVVCCHGFCSAQKVAALLGMSHACVVPTRSDYEAAFEMVCAEAILANRPIIASAVCPAVEDLRAASIEVRPNCVEEYYRAIVDLNDDPALYSRKQSACATLHKPFYDPDKSWAAKIKEALYQLQVKTRSR
jgi:glycogen synthase